MTLVLILIAVGCLAYANGANDNFKGVATLFGSGATNYRGALTWATVATLLGSLTAVFLAGQLLHNFSGRGLVDDGLVSNLDYAAAVAFGTALAVLIATRFGLPISTTHGLVGALIGAGWAAGSAINLNQLGANFFMPLVVSPVLALAVTSICYACLHFARVRFGISERTCFCVGNETVEVVPVMTHGAALQRVEHLTVQVGDVVTCQNRYQGKMLGIDASHLLDRSHFLSAGVVSFARGLNDTPKIAALLLITPQLNAIAATAVVGVLIAAGGIFSARKVAETMSQRITTMNHGQGFTANLITGMIVIGASNIGLPVSTTHVSCGSLFGIGIITGKGQAGTIGKILGAWLLTLPLGAILASVAYLLIRRL